MEEAKKRAGCASKGVKNAQVRANDAQLRVTVTPDSVTVTLGGVTVTPGLTQMRANDAQGRKNDAPRRAEKVIYTPFSGGKEKGREKETFPPAPPIEKKGSQKKQSPVFFEPGYSKPARARVRARKRRLPCTCSYADAGDAAREIIGNCFGNFSDLRLWAWYCRHFNRERIVDKAYEYASMCRQRELHDAITAFQAWLSKEFKDAPKEGGAR